MTIAEAERRMQAVVGGLENEVMNNIVPKVEDVIVKQQQARLMKGEYVSGSAIFPDYTAFTVSEKIRKNQDPDHVTLRDTGAFHDAIFVQAYGGLEDGIFEIDSSDSKRDKLIEKYEENDEWSGQGQIFGMNEENKTDIKEVSTPMLREYASRITGFE